MLNLKGNVSVFHRIIITIILIVAAGCATAPKPSLMIAPGKEVDTIQSAVSFSLKAGESSRSARGYLLFQRPDRLHLVVLGPFNMTMMEIYGDGDRLTCIIPTKGVACAGYYSEIPSGSGMRSLEIMKWVVQTIPASEIRRGETIKRTGNDGQLEQVTFDEQGLVVAKNASTGEHLFFRDYAAINDVAFPTTIEYRNSYGVVLKMTFNDPQVNDVVQESALKANLEGLNLVPLSACGALSP